MTEHKQHPTAEKGGVAGPAGSPIPEKTDVDTNVEKELAKEHEKRFGVTLGGHGYMVTQAELDEYKKKLEEVEKTRGELSPDDARFLPAYVNAKEEFNVWVATTLKGA